MCNLLNENANITLERGMIMNQEHIGKFISKKRKEKNLTQEALAEKLGVSINAVSKWERGICLMDMSLLKPLSNILDISINEILQGEEISEKELKDKADENIIKISELYNLKATKKGVIALTIIALILIIYCGIKNINSSGYVSMICGYNGLFYCTRYNYNKDKSDLITGVISLVAMSLNIFAFILYTI